MFQKGFKTLGCAIVPILIFSQTAMAAPLSIIYQTKDNQTVQADYVNALANPPMKAALINGFLAAEIANLPIFITDDNGSVINYTAALSRNEDYSAALNDSAVNHATAPVATQKMNADGSVTPLAPSAPFTYSSTTDLLGNTIINVTVTAQNVTGVTVKGTAAIQVGTSNVWRAGLVGSVIVTSSDITLVTGNNPPNNGPASVSMMPSSVNSVLGGSQAITVTAQDAYGNPISNQTIYLQTGIQGLWLTQVNGTMISGSVNMGTSSVPSMQTLNTPVPLFNLGTGTSVPAYQSTSVQGLTAYHLNDNINPIVALTTGVDGTVSVTLVDGNVTYVANTATTSGTPNSFAVDSGTPISQQSLSCFSDSGQTQKLGSILLNWGGTINNIIGALGITDNNSLLPQCNSLNSVPQVFNFTNNVGDARTIYAAPFNKNGKIIAPAAGNQFDSYGLVFDLTAPDGVYFNALGSTTLTYDSTHKGVKKITAHYTQSVAGLVPDLFMYEDGTTITTGFPIITGAYDNYGQINFGVQSDPTTSINNSGVSGSVGITINAFSSSASSINMNDHQGTANGTVSAKFMAINTIGSLGVAPDLSGFNAYYPLLTGQAAPASTLTVAGIATPAGNRYDATNNASFVTAPFNSYPAIGTISSQGLTMNISSDKNGVISNVDGYTLASTPTNATVNVNSLGEVSVNNLKLWTAQSGYQVVGYLPGDNGSVTLLEESTTTPGNFAAYTISSVGATPVLADSWTGLAASSLAGSFEGYLGFSVDADHNLIPQAASKYKTGWSIPAQTAGKSLASVEFTPVVVTKVYASDKNPEAPTITITNSLDSQTATVSANFKAATSSGSTSVLATPSSVKSAMGGSQKITLIAQDAYGTPIANRTFYLGTGMPGLWISNVNGTFVTNSVNIGTSSSISTRTVYTPVPLFSVSEALAYTSVAVTGLTAYNLDKANPVVALITGSDGTVSITLVDGNVTYVANTATANTANSYAVDPGTPLNKTLVLYADAAGTQKVGSVQVSWN
jgi:hypothetical protein